MISHVLSLFYKRHTSHLLTFLWASKLNSKVGIRNKEGTVTNYLHSVPTSTCWTNGKTGLEEEEELTVVQASSSAKRWRDRE